MDDKRHGRNHVATRRRGEEVIMSLTIYRFHHGFLRGKQTLYTSFSRTRGEERLAPPTQCTYSKSIPFERYGALRRMMNETNFVERAARRCRRARSKFCHLTGHCNTHSDTVDLPNTCMGEIPATTQRYRDLLNTCTGEIPECLVCGAATSSPGAPIIHVHITNKHSY